MSDNKHVKGLYVASTMGALQENVYKKLDVLKKLEAKECCGRADIVYLAGDEALRSGDEERAYILLMRYMEMLNIVRKKPEYKKDAKYFNSLLGLTKFERALTSCDRLHTSLKSRYALKQEEQDARELLERREKRLLEQKPKSTQPKPGDLDTTSSRRASQSTSAISLTADVDTTITCPLLNTLIKQESSSYLIIDTRPAADFATSRLVSRFVVNVPAELLVPGVTAPALQTQLADDDSQQLFARRCTVDRLVVLDWTSGGSTEQAAAGGGGGPLDVLRDAMTKWDMSEYRAPPVTLAGGYQMWLHTYPMLTTNPQVSAPPSDHGQTARYGGALG